MHYPTRKRKSRKYLDEKDNLKRRRSDSDENKDDLSLSPPLSPSPSPPVVGFAYNPSTYARAVQHNDRNEPRWNYIPLIPEYARVCKTPKEIKEIHRDNAVSAEKLCACTGGCDVKTEYHSMALFNSPDVSTVRVVVYHGGKDSRGNENDPISVLYITLDYSEGFVRFDREKQVWVKYPDPPKEDDVMWVNNLRAALSGALAERRNFERRLRHEQENLTAFQMWT